MKLSLSFLTLLLAGAFAQPGKNYGQQMKQIKAVKKGQVDLQELAGFEKGNPLEEIQARFEVGGPTRTFRRAPGRPGQAPNYWFGENGLNTLNLVASTGGLINGALIDVDNGMVCDMSQHLNARPLIARIVCRRSRDFPDEADPEESDRRLRGAEGNDLQLDFSSNSNASQRDLEGNAVIDVMVPWTRNAECRKSGLARGCATTSTTRANMEAHIDLAVQMTNAAYQRSGINAELNLVHKYLDDYVEADSNAFGTALSYFRQDSNVQSLRTQQGADVVAVLIDDSQYCGMAYLGPRTDLMFSVTAWNCATGYMSFAHEIGHNMGCNHDKGTQNACTSTSKNYGYRDPQGDFRTVLAYNCVSGQCDNNAGGGCTRLQVFSNPGYYTTADGKPTGNAGTDNAQQINEVASTIAAYHASVSSCSSNSDCNDSDSCTVDICQDGVCSNTPMSCDDSDSCTVDICQDGVCSFTPITCDDGDACTTDVCNPSTGTCTNEQINCNDGDLCTTDTCIDGTCSFTPNGQCTNGCTSDDQCSDGNACTLDLCNPDGSCTNPPKCNDNDLCTTDTCDAGVCSYTPVSCDDGDQCTDDTCNLDGTCSHTSNGQCTVPVCLKKKDNEKCTSNDECCSNICEFRGNGKNGRCNGSSPDLISQVAGGPSDIAAADGANGSEQKIVCFSAVNEVEAQGEGLIAMDALKVGDYVRAGKDHFSRVYGFLHLNHDIEAEFLQIYSNGLRNPLEISPDHMVFVQNWPIPASQVKVGDILGVNKVEEIKTIKRRGVYAPVTESGGIVVNGVLASSYAAVHSHTPINQHWEAHAFFSSRRLICAFDFEICKNETYTNNGYPDWLYPMINFALSTKQSPLLQSLLTAVGLPIIAVTYVLEQAIRFPFIALGALIVGHFIYKMTKTSKVKNQ